MMDSEDIALSTFASVFNGIEAGRFHNVDNRNELQKLSFSITASKAVNAVRRQHSPNVGVAERFPKGS